MRHDLKCWPHEFQALLDGKKRHEFRRNDRCFEVGDLLHLREWDPNGEHYTDRDALVRVTYRGTGFGIPEGYVCLSVAWPEYRKCIMGHGPCEHVARHGPTPGDPISCWAHAGDWPEQPPVLVDDARALSGGDRGD